MNTCWLFHRWSKWADFKRSQYCKTDGRPMNFGTVQERRCERCGALDRRTQWDDGKVGDAF